MAFINCIIISTPVLKDRIRIRNEFIGLKLFNILNDLKIEAVTDTDLAVQIDVFDEQRESDESQLQGKFLRVPCIQRNSKESQKTQFNHKKCWFRMTWIEFSFLF